MELFVENLSLTGKFKKKKQLRVKIPLTKEIVSIFREWEDERKGTSKKSEYSRDLEYKTLSAEGILYGCFPIIGLNEKYVSIIFDKMERTK